MVHQILTLSHVENVNFVARLRKYLNSLVDDKRPFSVPLLTTLKLNIDCNSNDAKFVSVIQCNIRIQDFNYFHQVYSACPIFGVEFEMDDKVDVGIKYLLLNILII